MSRSAGGDTFDRSLTHWSEAGRREMETFYRVATRDYRALAEAWDWDRTLRDRLGDRATLRILDVACGSGKFPAALRAHTRLGELPGSPLVLDLLDPSRFSLREAAASLGPPFRAGASLEHTLQALPADAGPYDVVWAVHALYAVPEDELAAGASAFLRALAPSGLGFVAHALEGAHYLSFYEAYRSTRPDVTPYARGEAVIQALRDAGGELELRRLTYEQAIDDEGTLEGFLQRCLFDDDLDLAAMRADAHLGPYLASARGDDGVHRFQQDVAMVFVTRG